ncbi:MAG: hypothetical protein KatS3mg031_0556 [Chitinophagales bacterium]|nr:MAG: hypothetical protein KatS3mg031_0556 [Chitinophagales bacterium]
MLAVTWITLPAGHLDAQCSGRYYDKIFPDFFNWQTFPIPTNLPSPVVYGSAVNYQGNTETLDMYIFQPKDDTLSKRPLVILAFGGSFLLGAKESPDIIALCNELTTRGFVTASIKYRIGVPTVDSLNMLKAVIRAVQDAKAAIRFFYKDAATTNTYRIDTNKIFMGGVSAGAFIGIHAGYIDNELEVPQWFRDIAQTLGGLEGSSGNPGYSTRIRGIINLAGAIGDTSWIDADDPPMVSMHGTDDGTVPYCSEVIEVQRNSIIMVDGSASIKYRTARLGINNPFFTWRGGGHVDFTNYFAFQPSKKPLVDTTVWFIRDFLYEELTGIRCNQNLKDAGWLPAPCGLPIPEPDTVTSTGLTLVTDDAMLVAPVPSDHAVQVQLPPSVQSASIAVFDNLGRRVKTYRYVNEALKIQKSDLGTGIFLLAVIPDADPARVIRHKLIFQ